MNIVRKTVAAFGLAALALSAFAATPAGAQGYHHLRHHQVRHAARLDRRAAHAAATGHYRAAARLRQSRHAPARRRPPRLLIQAQSKTQSTEGRSLCRPRPSRHVDG